MARKVTQGPMCVGLTSMTGLLWLLVANTAAGQTAEAYYASDVEAIVQDFRYYTAGSKQNGF